VARLLDGFLLLAAGGSNTPDEASCGKMDQVDLNVGWRCVAGNPTKMFD